MDFSNEEEGFPDLEFGVRDPMAEVKEEWISDKNERKKHGEAISADGEVEWEVLKNTYIKWKGRTITNPWVSRLETRDSVQSPEDEELTQFLKELTEIGVFCFTPVELTRGFNPLD